MKTFFLIILFLSTNDFQENKIEKTKDNISIEIKLINNSDREKEARRKLINIMREFELKNWIYTTHIEINDDGVPHSHPILTLTTESEYYDDKHLQLSTFIHEQMHWYQYKVSNKIKSAINSLKEVYNNVPIGRSEGGFNKHSTYLH